MWRNWDPCVMVNVKWCICCGRKSRVLLKELNVNLPNNLAIPLLGIYASIYEMETFVQKILVNKC